VADGELSLDLKSHHEKKHAEETIVDPRENRSQKTRVGES
jgi:hypothetical protein